MTQNKFYKDPQLLYKHGALAPGSDLWIVPNVSVSEWTRKIDWYLNFQLSKARHHKPQSLSEGLKSLLQKNNIPEVEIELSNNSLMVSSQQRLPNKQLVELPTMESEKEWVELAHKIWTELGKPSLRIFLPSGFNTNDFSRLWPETISQKISLVTSQLSQ